MIGSKGSPCQIAALCFTRRAGVAATDPLRKPALRMHQHHLTLDFLDLESSKFRRKTSPIRILSRTCLIHTFMDSNPMPNGSVVGLRVVGAFWFIKREMIFVLSIY